MAIKKFKSYKMEETERKAFKELTSFAKSLDIRNLIKNNEDIKKTFSFLKQKIEEKSSK